ncbi:MAG: FecR domain-containing protein [Bacteroidota bacterium]|jgi:transmembrane sensor|nr:MAG: iron dicitrate transport regulator FecR [Bacteroidota bacterium]
MKDYPDFDAGDLAQDESFIRWVKSPTPELESRWTAWLEEHPDKAEEVQEARRMVLAVLSEPERFPTEYQKEMMWNRVQREILLEEKPSVWQNNFLRIAALLLLSGGLSYFAFLYSQRNEAGLENSQAKSTIPEYSERVNNGKYPLKMILSDGSSIVLQPNSSLRYPQSFGSDSREVYLEGEALFDIARDPHRPFLVYANELVTKVLGTSFSIRAYENEPNVIVEVRSGKVSVFAQPTGKAVHTSDSPRREGLVLSPNQQAVYSREDARLTKSLFENPSLLIPEEEQRSFEFVDAKMGDVFAALEKAYGVEIVYDEEIMSGCYLNASLTDESLQVKLSLICKAVNATYEIMDTHIIVYGKGCTD